MGIGISNDSKYYLNNCLGQSQITEQNCYKVQSGDTLWDIAKRELGSGATNAQISDYMFLIANANGLDTKAKRNNLKISQNLVIPPTSNIKNVSNSSKSKSVSNPKRISKPVQANTNTTRTKTHSEQVFAKRIDRIKNDKNVNIRKSDIKDSQLYHVFGKSHDREPLMSYKLDKSGNISEFYFNDDKRISETGWDYRVSRNDRLIKSFKNFEHGVYGYLEPSDIANLEDELRSVSQK